MTLRPYPLSLTLYKNFSNKASVCKALESIKSKKWCRDGKRIVNNRYQGCFLYREFVPNILLKGVFKGLHSIRGNEWWKEGQYQQVVRSCSQ